MPAPIPPGYTRGPILFVGPAQERAAEEQLLQFFWEEAGAYGSRIVVVPPGDDDRALAQRYAQLFTEWESDSVQVLAVPDRAAALHPDHLDAVTGSTAVLLLGRNPVRLASLLGGTPLAQAIRRANARGKAVGGVAGGAQLLCEHMMVVPGPALRDRPSLGRNGVQLAPGLGITNRVLLDPWTDPAAEPVGSWARLARLLQAVAYNPFLVGVSLDPAAGGVIYPDNTLEIFGCQSALLVDAAGMTYTDVHELGKTSPMSLLGVQVHALGPGFTFNLNQRTAHPPEESDIPDSAVPDERTTM